ncbi:MAG: hypothetical protein K9H14_03105 [Actinomycetia bacterium]|nr:hypothetical protein [Actinomycetes bacterium]
MIDHQKLKKAPYMTKRMYIIREICELNGVKIEYLFGLFNFYNQKNKGRWFWQRAQFTGVLKDNYDKFNQVADEIAKQMKVDDEQTTNSKIQQASTILDQLMQKMESNLEVDRVRDQGHVIGFLDNNLKSLIYDGLKDLD